MKDFRNLIVWQKAHELTLALYPILSSFPKDEIFGLTRQMKRSATSIATNIAEGCGRKSKKEFHYFLMIASGSASELEYQLILSADLNFLPREREREISGKIQEVKKMLYSLSIKLHQADG